MTSWSLTVLFVHLWISAFIVLYFYSISKKSTLARIFSYIFGPFSCTKIRKSYDTDTTVKYCPKVDSPSGKIKHVHHTGPRRDDEDKSKELFLLENSNKKLDSEEDQNAQASKNKLKTYCDNKDSCNLPSIYATSDAVSWQLWIDTHVPCVILVLIKISWLLYNLLIISALVVTSGYFTYVTIYEIQVEPSWVTEIGNLHRHGVNSIVAIVDLLIMAYPVRILHFVYTSLYGWLYAVVTFLYWLQNTKENIIYDKIDYNRPLLLMFFYCMLTVLTLFLQTCHFFAYKFKVYLKKKYIAVNENCF